MAKKQSEGEKRQAVLDNAALAIDAEIGTLDELREGLEEIRGNLEEKFSETDKYQRLESLLDELSGAIDQLKEAQNTLDGLNCDYVNG